MSSHVLLRDVALGDVLVLPDGRAMTVRAHTKLPTPAGSMSSFVVLGELDALLSLPASPTSPLLVYVPIDYLPDAGASARVVCEGATNYWAPHLPALQGAMGELLYRVLLVRGSIDPIVIVYRGPEVIVFIRAALAQPDSLTVLAMDRADTSQIEVARHTAVVTPARTAPRLDAPSSSPAPRP